MLDGVTEGRVESAECSALVANALIVIMPTKVPAKAAAVRRTRKARMGCSSRWYARTLVVA